MDDTQLIEVDAGRGIDASNGHDLVLVRRAIRQGWKIPDDLMAQLPETLANIAINGKDDRSKIAASRVLVQMHGQNQKNDPATRHVEHTHEIGPITVANMEERRQQLREMVLANGRTTPAS